MMPNVGPLELLVVMIIALIVLGPKRLPEVGRSVGRGLREFRGGLSGEAGRGQRYPDEDEEYEPESELASRADAPADR
jgi:sec-independent protein translocase protein TatA